VARPSNAIPWLLVVLLSGGLMYRPGADAARSSSSGDSWLNNSAGGRAGKADDSKKNDAKPVPDRHRDALDVLGEHVGVDLSDDGLLDAAQKAAQLLLFGPHSHSPTAKRDLHEAIARLLQGSAANLPLSDVSKARVAGWLEDHVSRPSPDAIARLDSSPTAMDDAARFLSNFFWQDRDERRLRVLTDAVGAIDVKTVIATLPDPIDSNVRWLFDPMLDAIQRAASDAHYVLDRFYIPDWNPEQTSDTDHSSEPVGAHERWPGVVLFRSTASNGGRAPLLMVFLVSETATSGVHQIAFERALTYSLMVRRIVDRGSDEGSTDLKNLAVLGPSFSGSVESMRATLRRFGLVHPGASFRIVSGGATASGVQELFENDFRLAGRVSYRATVLPDTMLLEGIEQHLRRVDPAIDQPGKIAILREANTEYGSSVAYDTQWRSESDTRWPSLFQQAISLPFPMHISRVRSEARPAPAPETKQAQTTPRRFGALRLDEPNTPSDQIPAFSPQLTSAAVELMVANIIDTITRERVRAVGLVATDARDKLFLAQQLSVYAPGVILFTLESDLMFIHPDYNKYVRGMIVASSYPLFAANQVWTSPSAGRQPRLLQQFSATNSEGVYNALLALVAYDGSGTPAADAPPLLDYRPPAPMSCFDHGCIPPVWISVVESDAIWPLSYVFPSEKREIVLPGPDGPVTEAPYPAQSVQLARLGPVVDRPVVRLSIGMGVLLVLFAGVALASVILLARWRWLLAQHPPVECRGFDRAAPATRYQRVALATIAVAGLPIAFVCSSGLLLTWSTPLRIDHAVDVVALGAELLVIGALIATRSMPDDTGVGAQDVPFVAQLLRVVMGVGVLLIALNGTFKGMLYLWRMWSADGWPVQFVRFLARGFAVDSGASPIVPLVLLALPPLCWAVLQLWRVGGPTLARVFDSPWIAHVAGDEGIAWRRCLRLAWLSPTGGLPVSSLTAILAGLAATLVACAVIRPSTIEPIAFSQFLAAVWLIAQLCIALTLAHAVWLWSLNRRLLAAAGASRLADAFARLPREVGVYGYLSPAPARADLVRPARFYNALGDELSALPAGTFDPATSAALTADFARPRPGGINDIQHLPWSDTTMFARLLEGADVIYTALRTRWATPPSTFFDRKADVETTDPAERWTLRAEEYLAMLITLVIRQLSARVVRELLFVTAGLVLVIVALSSFPIYPLQPLIGYAWGWAAIAATAGIWVSVTMERDPILSRLTGTPNRVTWNLAFTTKLIVYVGIPLVTLFAAQFPAAGGTLLRWLTPIQPLP
jgi:hypothetical protein